MVARLKASGLTVCFNLQRTCVMHTKSKIVLALVAGVALGAGAVQGLHAQAKPKAFLVTESEILDRAAVPPYGTVLSPAMQAAGGHWVGGGTGPTEKITAVIGDPPKRFGVVEFENLD